MFSAAKQARLRQAKEEAEKEIAEFRAQMEADFQRKLAEVKSLKRIDRTQKYLENYGNQYRMRIAALCLSGTKFLTVYVLYGLGHIYLVIIFVYLYHSVFKISQRRNVIVYLYIFACM